jgi:hypothetical protein
MYKRKLYKCSVCGAKVPDLPMPVLKHQISHVRRRPFAGDRREPDPRDHQRPAPPTPVPDLEVLIGSITAR